VNARHHCRTVNHEQTLEKLFAGDFGRNEDENLARDQRQQVDQAKISKKDCNTVAFCISQG